jgi:Tol biopolymer transport system component
VASAALIALIAVASPVFAQRRPVLPQIDEPHPYYYRELYLPQLTSGPSSLSWGPDSQELVYSMAGSLWRQRLDSKEAMQITDGAGYDYQPDWSPDGKSVVYVSYQKDAMELWLLDLVSGKTKQLTSGGAVNVEPRWSPDGTKIVWVSTQYNRRFHVFMADFVDGELKNAVRLTGETKSPLPRYYYSAYDMEITPVWTRDGKEILFVSNKGHIYGTGGFWLMKAAPGAEAHEIHYEETSWKARPDFSPDGSRMVYSSYLGREWHNLWVMPAKGGDAFPLTYGSACTSQVRWSPDGRMIAYVAAPLGIPQIWTVTIPGGRHDELEAYARKYIRPYRDVVIEIFDENNAKTPARISVTDQRGKFVAPSDELVHADDGYDRSRNRFEAHYVYMRHTDSIEAPKDLIRIDVSKGLEYEPQSQTVDLSSSDTKKPTVVQFHLKRMGWKSYEGSWISSDLHVHMNYGGTYELNPKDLLDIAEAEGVRIVNNLLVNKEQRFPDIESIRFRDDDWSRPNAVYVRGQEFHTSYWGHRGVLRLKDHLLLPGYAGYPNTAAASLYPMNADVYDMAHEQGALVGAVHPFDEVPDPFAKPAQRITDELPVDVALGKLDYMEIVGFSDHKSTAEVWYKLLNLGFRIPAGGGTDATTDYAAPIRGQVGFDRVYVWTPSWPAPIESFMDGLKRGRTFATNGPLVEFKLGGEMVGSELKFDAPQSAVPFTAKLRSIVPADHLEIVCNGRVVQSLLLDGAKDSADMKGTIPLKESGWCVLRAWSEKAEYPVMDKYTYATTSPVYVTIGGKRAYSKQDADYFQAWIDRTIEATDAYPDWNSAEEKKLVMGRLREARRVYEGLK